MNREDGHENALKIAAVITAAGSSDRMGGIKKEYRILPSASLTVLGSAAMGFAACKRIGIIVFVIPAGGEAEARAALPPNFFDIKKEIFFVQGGPTRQGSVYNALCLLEAHKPTQVLIHDGARPWIKTDLIDKVIDAVLSHGAVIPILPMTETPKEIDYSGSGTGIITRHLRRRDLGLAQTPQAFNFPDILKAHKKASGQERSGKALSDKEEYTDDAEIWGKFIGPVAVIPGDPQNRKITFLEDLEPRITRIFTDFHG
ncbi:MAG: 2-C-methyl-D-erythritol 4-phosphate cytidylyltransferase [Treponema sp.]|jgi:2-C-methyl-D-erythritol 4-phosphate cytidylyltransferase|nr:2-C-methyl-D-erythritol 4-phosphate cytidylyltransferase [Treponema sp.]